MDWLKQVDLVEMIIINKATGQQVIVEQEIKEAQMRRKSCMESMESYARDGGSP